MKNQATINKYDRPILKWIVFIPIIVSIIFLLIVLFMGSYPNWGIFELLLWTIIMFMVLMSIILIILSSGNNKKIYIACTIIYLILTFLLAPRLIVD